MEETTNWIEIKSVVKTFQLKDEPELIHIIKTGFVDKYMIVYEDAYELMLGNVEFASRENIEKRFKIKL